MATTSSQRFDYDKWAALARDNPAAFEVMRQHEIDGVIATASVSLQQRLRCLQWRIDMERKKCANPLSACLRLYSMMWDTVLDEHGFVSALALLANPDLSIKNWQHGGKTAQILPFTDTRQSNKPY